MQPSKFMHRLMLFFLLLLGCNTPYAKFEYGDNSILVCGQDGKAIITDSSCSEFSSDHLVLTDSGITGGMSLFVNLCNNSNNVIAFGYFEIIGKPRFSYELYPWNEYILQKDSLYNVYQNKDCKFEYSE